MLRTMFLDLLVRLRRRTYPARAYNIRLRQQFESHDD
jgi:hypothetical protein